MLALLPLDDTLAAAAALQARTTRPPLPAQPGETHPCLHPVGAIEFVHIRTPLTRCCKTRTACWATWPRRTWACNAIAVSRAEAPGLALQWAMPWEQALDENNQVRIAPWRSSLPTGTPRRRWRHTLLQQILLPGCRACCSVLPGADHANAQPCCWPDTCTLGAAGQAHRHGARGTRRPLYRPADAMPPTPPGPVGQLRSSAIPIRGAIPAIPRISPFPLPFHAIP